jgi:maleate isomerase
MLSKRIRQRPSARIGMIYPAGGVREDEFVKLVPRDVAVHVTRVDFGRATLEDNRGMFRKLVEPARLLSRAKVDLIHFNCTTGSLIGGRGYDKRIIRKIEKASGTPALTTTTAVILALQRFNIQKVALIAPYPKEIIVLEKRFLRDSGVEVTLTGYRSTPDPLIQGTTPSSIWTKLAIDTVRNRQVDGIFISCAGIKIVDQINEIEEATRLPAVTSNQAAAWACLRKLGIRKRSKRFGRLLREF